MRRSGASWGILLAAAVVVAPPTNVHAGEEGKERAAKARAARPVVERRFLFTYGAVAEGIPPGARVQVWFPIPRRDRFQRVTVVESSTPGDLRWARDETYGNRIGYFETTAPASGEVAFSRVYRVRRREAVPYADPHVESARKRFRAPNRLVPTAGKPLELLRDVALPADRTRLPRALYDRVLGFMRYDKSGSGWGRGDAVWACESGYGNCTDFHSLWISLARSLGLPARFEIGFPLPGDRGEGEIGGYHCWAWCYEGDRWIPVDISEADRNPERTEYFYGHLDVNRIHLTTGRDIALRPAPAGEPLNYFISPHIEVDGRLFEGKWALRHRFRDLEPVGDPTPPAPPKDREVTRE